MRNQSYSSLAKTRGSTTTSILLFVASFITPALNHLEALKKNFKAGTKKSNLNCELVILCCLLVHGAHLEFVFLLCVGLCAVFNKWLAVSVNTSCLVLVALHKMGGVALYKCFPPSRTSLLLLPGNYFRQL